MTLSAKARRTRVLLLFATALVAAVGTFSMPPIAQDLAYHDFADGRAFLGIPNFGDVTGNIPFAIVGLLGLVAVWKRWFFEKAAEFWLWIVFFAGVFAVAFGSGYYHLAPDNHTLVWDRLPMTAAFMSLFSIIIMERVDRQWGLWLFPLFLAAGVFSVVYWDYTEGLGRGDLRPYALVQFFPMLAILMMIALFPPKFPGATKYIFYTLGWYVAAKLLEHFDKEIFALLQGAVSGHTLKHIAAAIGVSYMICYVKAGKAA